MHRPPPGALLDLLAAAEVVGEHQPVGRRFADARQERALGRRESPLQFESALPYLWWEPKAREDALTNIPQVLQEHINTAYPAHVCLVGTTLPNGYAQITPRGSTMVFDDEHFALWERGRGSTNANLADGTKVTIYFRKPPLRESGLLPRGGIARFYGTAKIYKSGPIYEEIWKRLIEPEKKGDPEKKGFGVLVKVERAEDLSGAPLAI